MDFIQTSNKQVDKFGPGKHGFSAGNPAGGVPATYFSPDWADAVQQELINIVEGAGVAPTAAVLTQVRQAIKRITGGNVTTVNFAGSPFALTADHAGMVLVDATAGNVVINLPAANVLAGLPYAFRRTDTSVNTVTVNRAGADTIDEGGISFALTSKAIQQVRSNGATTWSTVAPVAATQAETDAGTDDAKFVTPKKLRFGFSASLNTNGYIAFPSWMGGLILQWGLDNTNLLQNSSRLITYPLAFTSLPFFISAQHDGTFITGITDTAVLATRTSLTQITFSKGSNGGGSASDGPTFWFALGK